MGSTSFSRVMTTFTFGRYKGRLVDAICYENPKYCIWAHENVKFFRFPHAGHMFRAPWVKNKAIQKMIIFLAELRLHIDSRSIKHPESAEANKQI